MTDVLALQTNPADPPAKIRHHVFRVFAKLRAAPPTLPVSALYFALTTTFAALLALFVAFWLQLDSPSSAMVTVLIVAAPVRGMVLSKSLYRMLGTFVGGGVALLLVDLCGQNSEIFIPALAVWVALCTALATMLRNFRAYAAVLAGYTVPLIGLSAIQAPEHAWDITIARVAVITVGIVCAGVVTSVFLPGGARRDLAPRLRGAILLTLSLAHDALNGAAEALPESRYVEATGRILGIDSLIEFAATESPRVARRANALRSAISALIAAITALRAIADLPPNSLTEDPELVADMRDRLDGVALRLGHSDAVPAESFVEMRARLALAGARVEQSPSSSLEALQFLDNLDELVTQIDAARLDLDAFVADRPARTIVSIGYPVDFRAALRNGFRAFLGIVAAGAFCYVTGWSDAAQMPLAVAVICSLLALQPNPAVASIAFAIGVCVGDIAALFCQFFLLSRVDGFPLLAMCVAPFLMAGLLATANPRLAGVASGFRIFFVVALAPTNPMTFNAASALNNALVSMVGAIFAAYVYRAVLPTNLRVETARLLRAISAELAQIRNRPAGDRAVTESRIYHRLIQLATRLDATAPEGQELLAKAYAESRMALALQRARAALNEADVTNSARDLLEKAISVSPSAADLSKAAHALAAIGRVATPLSRQALIRAAAALAEAATLVAVSSNQLRVV